MVRSQWRCVPFTQWFRPTLKFWVSALHRQARTRATLAKQGGLHVALPNHTRRVAEYWTAAVLRRHCHIIEAFHYIYTRDTDVESTAAELQEYLAAWIDEIIRFPLLFNSSRGWQSIEQSWLAWKTQPYTELFFLIWSTVYARPSYGHPLPNTSGCCLVSCMGVSKLGPENCKIQICVAMGRLNFAMWVRVKCIAIQGTA